SASPHTLECLARCEESEANGAGLTALPSLRVALSPRFLLLCHTRQDLPRRLRRGVLNSLPRLLRRRCRFVLRDLLLQNRAPVDPRQQTRAERVRLLLLVENS